MVNKKRNILYITGTRADYGLMRNTLIEIVRNPKLTLSVVATGMHTLNDFGNTILDVKKDSKIYGFDLIVSKCTYNSDSRHSMSGFVGSFISELTEICKKNTPDIILVLGDRGEMFAGGIVGVYLGIPVAHIHGGDVSSTVDDVIRHSLTKLSSIHFSASKKSSERIIKMGEDPKNVFNVGAPGLDCINDNLLSFDEISKKYHISKNEKYLMMIQHPVSAEITDAEAHVTETLNAIVKSRVKTIISYPNADAGGRKIISVIKKYENNPLIKSYNNLNHKEFLSLLKYSSGLIGNSSAGIIEVASFKKPVINIGTRQLGREKTFNVIDVGYDCGAICAAINKILNDSKFVNSLKKCVNPYGSGNAGKQISKVLSEISIDDTLIQKRLTYD